MTTRRALLLLFSCCFFHFVSMAQSHADLARRLDQQVPQYSISGKNLLGTLIQISNDFQIPMGICWELNEHSDSEEQFSWKKATVRSMIEDIIKSQPGYKTEVSASIVHILAPIPDRQNFLSLRIGNFSLQDEFVEMANYRLHDLAGTFPSGSRQISVAGPGDSRVTLDLTDATLGAALDAIVGASNRKLWVVTFSSDTHLGSRGFRKSLLLWNDRSKASHDEPTWAFLRWGDPPPPLVLSPPKH